MFLAVSSSGNKEINSAELSAIYLGLLCTPSRDVEVLTDSMTALDLLNGRLYKKQYQLLVDCINFVSDTMYDNVTYTKVKSHSGNHGNEMADKLAKIGTIGKYSFVFPDPGASIKEVVNKNIYKNSFIHDRIFFL